MKKKILTILALGVMVIMTLGLFAGCGNFAGNFYSLQEAFDNEWLTHEDLQSLSYYYSFKVVDGGSNKDEDFVPKPKDPELIDRSTEKAIKQSYLTENKIKKDFPFASIDRIHVEYFGTYNGYIAVIVSDDYYGYDYLFEDTIIDGVLFKNFSRLCVFRKNAA